MKRTIAVASIIAGWFAVVSTSEASSARNFPSYIPNGTCTTCHNTAAGGANNLNQFGEQVRQNLSSAGFPDWAAIVDLDADNDGQTNGQELGDPMGVWSRGMRAPRTSDISAPSDPASMAANPDAIDDPSAMDDAGGCNSTGARADAPTWGLLFAGFAALYLMRRKRERQRVGVRR